jgi:predicted nucleic acid-binding protein
MLRVMLDSNAFNALALDDRVRAMVERAVDGGLLELVVTHVQADELSRTPDADLRRRLLRLTVVATMTAAFVIGVSRVGMAAIGTDEENAIYEAVTNGNVRHAEDALILITARREGIPVVTDEKRLPKQCRQHNVQTMTTHELLLRIASQD